MGARRCLIRRLLLVTGVVVLLPACQSTPATTAPTPDADFVSCAGEIRALPYQMDVPRMQVRSAAGPYLLKVLSNTFTDESGSVLDEAPARGVDVWTIEVDAIAGVDAGADADAAADGDAGADADAADAAAPVDGLAITVIPYMPDHGHGTTPVGVTAAGGGRYTIAPLNLYMAGLWEIRFTLATSSTLTSVSDNAVVKICVPD